MPTEVEKRHQREYETIFILAPRVAREQAERVVQRLQDVLTRQEGKLVRVEYWGKRKLSYRIRLCDWGFYYCVRFVGAGGLVAELERNLRLLDPVIRFQTIQAKDDVDPASYQVVPGDVEFRLDLLAKEAAEPIAEHEADAAVAEGRPAAAADEGGAAGEAAGEVGEAKEAGVEGEDAAAAEAGAGGREGEGS
jgi:small subunit ribosomal protein S6